MFQQFFEDTIISRYIKGLLSGVRIPKYTLVSPGDVLLQGCVYLYEDWIIRCTGSGRLFIENVSTYDLYPGKEIFPSVTMFPGTGETSASFVILQKYYNTPSNENYSFYSNCNYYDSDTHYHLGQYLRYLKHSTGINLMPYYNCFNHKVIDGISLTNNGLYYELIPDNNYKLLAVPIKFGRLYTVAVDCSSEVRCRCFMYGDSGLLLDESSSEEEIKYLSDIGPFPDSYRSFNTTSFSKPFTFRIDTNIGKLHSMERNLYLIVRLPKSNSSSFVVLEGDYTNNNYSVVKTDSYDYTTGDTGELVPVFNPNLSLLFANSKKTFAFSDRLIEYLTGGVITEVDEIAHNIKRVQEALLTFDSTYRTLAKDSGIDYGSWDDELTHTLKLILSGNAKQFELDESGNVSKIYAGRDLPFMLDRDAHINKEMERYLMDKVGGIYV